MYSENLSEFLADLPTGMHHCSPATLSPSCPDLGPVGTRHSSSVVHAHFSLLCIKTRCRKEEDGMLMCTDMKLDLKTHMHLQAHCSKGVHSKNVEAYRVPLQH